jgi:3-deoxy-manno-octulosonate cytidylyltransferase (CMP-KDO synthetase)
VIPARYGSTRLPGKPLLPVKGKPLVMWVYDRAVESQAFARVCVATDDPRIADAVRERGGPAVRTAPDHASGTDRVNEAVRHDDSPFIVNLQGDEPDVPAPLLRAFSARVPRLDDNTLLTCVADATIVERDDPHVVKAVLDARGDALYFSRSAIPFDRSGGGGRVLKHIGIYGFSRRGLQRFCALPRGRLEQAEQLEQLRALEHGMTVACMHTDYAGQGIDTQEDLELFRRAMER